MTNPVSRERLWRPPARGSREPLSFCIQAVAWLWLIQVGPSLAYGCGPSRNGATGRVNALRMIEEAGAQVLEKYCRRHP